VFLGGQLLAYFDDGADDPIQVVSDHIGMPILAIDSAGATVWEGFAEPYGSLRGTSSEAFDPGLRYPGQWQDDLDLEASCSGGACTFPGILEPSYTLFENGYRWYRGPWGRYTQADPLGYHDREKRRPIATLFGYAHQSPLRFLDPVGLIEWECRYGGVSVYAGIGFSLLGVTCVSECDRDERHVGTYLIKAVGAGGGLTLFPSEASSYLLEDGHYYASASNLEGVFDIINMTAAWDGGVSVYWVRQGDGWGEWPGAIGDTWHGRGAGAFVARGSSVLTNKARMRCCPLPYPEIGPR